MRLGYFPNLTHAPALVGLDQGLFEKALGPGVKVEPTVFNAGPAAVTALLSGALDATYIGPNPAVNAYVKSKGTAVRIVSGVCAGGAAFVVRPEINAPADLEGKNVAAPQVGGTQDVALRKWLKANGVNAVVQAQQNAQALDAFRQGIIVGAWVPEPWATRLVVDGGGKVLVDEATLWPEGRFVTTVLLVSKKLLDERPQVVDALVRGNRDAIALVRADPAKARTIVNAQLEKLTGKAIPLPVLEAAWAKLDFSPDVLDGALRKAAQDAVEVGLLDLEGADLAGLFERR